MFNSLFYCWVLLLSFAFGQENLDWKDIQFVPPLSSLPTKLGLEDSVTVSVTTPCVGPSAVITWRYQQGVAGVPSTCTYSSEEDCPPGLSRTHSTLTIHRTDPYTPQVILTISVEHDSFYPPTNIRSQTLHTIEFPSCPDEWIRYELSCYTLREVSKTWQQAEDACKVQRGHLVSIETEEENTFLKQLAKSSKDRPYTVWTGATDALGRGDYRWISTNKTLTYTDWGPGEPTDTHPKSGVPEDCMNLHGTSDYKWNDESCETKGYYICEKQL